MTGDVNNGKGLNKLKREECKSSQVYKHQQSEQVLLKKKLHNQESNVSSVFNPSEGVVDPNEPKIIVSFTLPYKIARDAKTPSKFKLEPEFPKHVIT